MTLIKGKPKGEVYWASLWGRNSEMEWDQYANGYRSDKAGLFQECQPMKGVKEQDMPVCLGQHSLLCAQ